MDVKIICLETNGGRGMNYEVELNYSHSLRVSEQEITEAEAEAIHATVVAKAGDNYNASEHLSVWHYAGKISWGAKGAHGADIIYQLASAALASKISEIETEKRQVSRAKLMAGLLDGSNDPLAKLNAISALIDGKTRVRTAQIRAILNT